MRVTEKDGCVPDDFYSTTNQRTARAGRRVWVEVERQRMDAVVVLDGGPRGVPQAARSPRRRSRRLRPRRHPRHARVPRSHPGRLRVHDQRDLVGAARRGQRRPHRRDDAPHPSAGLKIAFVAGPVVVHTGGGALLHRADPARLRGRPARGQRARRARRRAGAVRHVARRGSRGRHAGSAAATAITCARSTRSTRRRNPRRRRGRRAEERRDGRVRPGGRPLRPRRQHPRRRADRRHGHGHRRGAGSVCGGAHGSRAW